MLILGAGSLECFRGESTKVPDLDPSRETLGCHIPGNRAVPIGAVPNYQLRFTIAMDEMRFLMSSVSSHFSNTRGARPRAEQDNPTRESFRHRVGNVTIDKILVTDPPVFVLCKWGGLP
jgi:hypothetical protein